MAVLSDLPPDALLRLCNHIAAAANTGQLLRLALVCKQYLELVAHADWFWQQQSASLGWIRTGFEHPPKAAQPVPACHSVSSLATEHPAASSLAAASPAAAIAAAGATAGQADNRPALMGTAPITHAAAPANRSTRLWFEYYCLRMSCRWRLRLLLRKYIPFLNIQSRLAMRAGASMQELEAAEAALGMQLPWELWELYRFRGGQAPGPGVCFADACRCLGVHELSVTTFAVSTQPSLSPDGPLTQQQQLAAVTAQLPALSCLPAQASCAADTGSCQHMGSTSSVDAGADACSSAVQQAVCLQQLPQLSDSSRTATSPASTVLAGPATQAGSGSCQHASATDASVGTMQAAAAGSDRDVRGVVFLSNSMGSVEYLAAQDSSVYLKRGFTTRRVASNLTGFIQHLLA